MIVAKGVYEQLDGYQYSADGWLTLVADLPKAKMEWAQKARAFYLDGRSEVNWRGTIEDMYKGLVIFTAILRRTAQGMHWLGRDNKCWHRSFYFANRLELWADLLAQQLLINEAGNYYGNVLTPKQSENAKIAQFGIQSLLGMLLMASGGYLETSPVVQMGTMLHDELKEVRVKAVKAGLGGGILEVLAQE